MGRDLDKNLIYLEIELDNSQERSVFTTNLITTVSLKRYLIFDIQVKDS